MNHKIKRENTKNNPYINTNPFTFWKNHIPTFHLSLTSLFFSLYPVETGKSQKFHPTFGTLFMLEQIYFLHYIAFPLL